LLIVAGELHVAPLSVDRGEVAVVADHAGTGAVPEGTSVRAWKTTSSVLSGATVTEAKNALCPGKPRRFSAGTLSAEAPAAAAELEP
jgi:hypothetical protein